MNFSSWEEGSCCHKQRSMSYQEMEKISFPEKTMEDWKRAAESALKGRAAESLDRLTYENIKLKPLYSAETSALAPISQYPGQEDYRRGIHPLGYSKNDWKIAQRISGETAEELKYELKRALENGQNAIVLPVEEHFLESFPEIMDGAHREFPFAINAAGSQSSMLAVLENLPHSKEIHGYIGKDPLSEAASNGLPAGQAVEGLYDDWAVILEKAAAEMPKLRTILADAVPYHNGGAHAALEIAAAAAAATEHVSRLLDRHISLEDILSKLVFSFASGGNFFMEIAKLRAARIIWGKIAAAFGAPKDLQKMVIAAETSYFTKTMADPYVNLLRSANEAFAAVIGGVQYLQVRAFNEVLGDSGSFSQRLARNIQLLLREEAHLLKVADPSGGSWYIESLTNELAEEAWNIFLKIESFGGMADALEQGWIQEQTREILEKKKYDAETRKKSIIGTNVYANLEDKLPDRGGKPKKEDSSCWTIRPLHQERLSVTFENLRTKAQELGRGGAHMQAGLISLGELKEHKIRSDFAAGFFAAGGIAAEHSPGVLGFSDAEELLERGYTCYCICGTNQQYEAAGKQLLKELKEKYPDSVVYLAGLPDSPADEWRELGIHDFITAKSNVCSILAKLLEETEVKMNG
jgi:methylmalonyl-CoA mutase